MTIEKRIERIERHLGLAPLEPTAIVIDDLATATLEAGKSYVLAARQHTVSAEIRVPAGVTISLGNASVIYSGRDWSALFLVDRASGVTVTGPGSAMLGSRNYFLRSRDAANLTLRFVTIENGGLYIDDRSRGITVESCVCGTIDQYLAFLSQSRDAVLRRCSLTEGSRTEAGIRLHGVANIAIEDCSITAGINKKSALRIHDGQDVVVTGGRFVGNVGAGPLGNLDGGCRWGMTRFFRGGRWWDPVDRETVVADLKLPPTLSWAERGRTVDEEWIKRSQAAASDLSAIDRANTEQQRARELGLRMERVRFEEVTVEGALVLKAGVVGFEMVGGSITAPNGGKVFEQWSTRYPELEHFTLPTDILRPPPTGRLAGVRLTQPGNPNVQPPFAFRIEASR